MLTCDQKTQFEELKKKYFFEQQIYIMKNKLKNKFCIVNIYFKVLGYKIKYTISKQILFCQKINTFIIVF
jgi:GTP-sensing pleiotropic transcriptional regulator CodY